eukprot:GILI01030875.1.p1 GENE.GILI01030875.1~~GILI01030875.1.p1  ORF type:complete len:255 (-),score=32.92 GILI01030875.1:101-865(-)
MKRYSQIYEAEELSEGLKAIGEVLPKWVVPAAVAGGLAAYVAVFQGRLALSKWRHRERELNERSGSSRAPSSFGADEADDLSDSSLLTFDEVEEFRRSLGIVVPRDDDLLAIVEGMLIEDPIPDGWELYRCTFGVRFRNTDTGELAFFHPDARELELHIRETLKERDTSFLGSDLAATGRQMFEQPLREEEEDNTHQTTFMNVFDAFLRREKESGADPATPRTRNFHPSATNRPMGSMRAGANSSQSTSRINRF